MHGAMLMQVLALLIGLDQYGAGKAQRVQGHRPTSLTSPQNKHHHAICQPKIVGRVLGKVSKAAGIQQLSIGCKSLCSPTSAGKQAGCLDQVQQDLNHSHLNLRHCKRFCIMPLCSNALLHMQELIQLASSRQRFRCQGFRSVNNWKHSTAQATCSKTAA